MCVEEVKKSCMARPVDSMTLDQLKNFRVIWTDELHEKEGAYNLLMSEISCLDLIDVATIYDWNAAAQMLRERAVMQRQSIVLLEMVIKGLTGRIQQLETAS